MRAFRILASSVDPWSEGIGSDTMSALLSQFESGEVASINIRAKRSDSPVAGHYFHIVEGRVIRSILHPSIVTGEAYEPDDGNSPDTDSEIIAENKRYAHKRVLDRWFYVLVREVLWKFGHWKSRQLDDFIESFNPDVFFFPIEGYIHFNRINRYIIKRFHPSRVVGYMWDDNFTFKQHPYNPLFLIHRLWLKRSVKSLINSCDAVFAISPQMKRELDAAFGIDSILLTKPARICDAPETNVPNRPIRILYTGKLIIGRAETVISVVDAIRKINSDGQKVLLDIYTDSVLSDSVRSRIEVEGCSRLHGFIPQQQVWIKQREADVLLFAESISDKERSARLSFSTKITDYLSAGKCIWAVGNANLSPLAYLKTEDAALVSNDLVSVDHVLGEMVNDVALIKDYARKAYECGNTKHNKEMIGKRFREVLTNCDLLCNA